MSLRTIELELATCVFTYIGGHLFLSFTNLKPEFSAFERCVFFVGVLVENAC